MRGSLTRASFWVAAAVLAAGCVTTRGAKDTKEEVVHFEPVVVVGDLELEKLNDTELFVAAKSYFAAGDHKQAARYYGRIADFHPQSSYRNEALFTAGVAHSELAAACVKDMESRNEANAAGVCAFHYEDALQRFNELADPAKGTGDQLRGAFRVGITLYRLGRYDQAAEIFKTVANRKDLDIEYRLEALTQQGICEVDFAYSQGQNNFEVGEATLRKALAEWQTIDNPDDEVRAFAGQAQYYIGEVYRRYYEHVALNPDKTVDELSKDLEYKAELLLSAQGHYLRAIRIGNGTAAIAAGSRIGGLYEDLYDHMLNSPAPKELNVEEADVYRQELRKKIRILITKAITIYERTLEAAERIGERNMFVDDTRARLAKMKELLLAEATSDEAAEVDAVKAIPEDKPAEKEDVPPPPAARTKKKPRT